VDGDGATDDIAVVAVRLLPAPLRLDLPGEPVQLSRVRQMVGRWALGAGLDPDAVEDLQLALGEAAVREPLLAEPAAGHPVTLDLTRLGFVTSVGVGLLLEAARTAGDLEALLPPAGPARHLLDLTGLTGVLQGLGRGESC
jgi:hypothetical protein